MADTVDVNELLIRIFEVLRMHQEAAFAANLAVSATVAALKEASPAFATAYDHHYWEMKQGKLGEENSTAVHVLDEMKQQLRAAMGMSSI